MIAPIPSRHPELVSQLGDILEQIVPNVEHMFYYTGITESWRT